MCSQKTLFPGATLGVLGGGQLGQMFTQAARTMGYKVVVLDPDPDCPAAPFADRYLQAGFEDPQALSEVATDCDAVTTEFENVPAASLRTLAESVIVCPEADAVEIAQNRNREKDFFAQVGVATTQHKKITRLADCAEAWQSLGQPAILKTATLGYDGKGQIVVTSEQQLVEGYESLRCVECILEAKVVLAKEISVIVARNAAGEVRTYTPGENVHRQGILHTTQLPASLDVQQAATAEAQALAIAKALNYCGVLAVEFFITDQGELLANEMAPRPHNSGHYSLDACVTSQFEQQVRAMCNLPLGDSRLLSPVIMLNLLGDLWGDGRPDFEKLLNSQCKLHLYGKKQARSGRKMGHLNCLTDSTADAMRVVEDIYRSLVD